MKNCPQIVELVNPSDAITFIATDKAIAGVAVLLLGRGAFGLTAQDGSEFVPCMLFGGHEAWLQENKIQNLQGFIEENGDAIAAFLETVAYGSITEREGFDAAIARMTPEKAAEHRAWWNDRNRSSMNDIGGCAIKLAAQLRTSRAKGLLPSCPPIILHQP